MHRRAFLKMAAALGICSFPACLLLTAGQGHASPIGKRKPFDYAWLKGHARYLAASPYLSRRGNLPASLKRISWDDYQAIHFRPDHSLWRQKESNFRLRFFHPGLFFQTPVTMHEVVDGQARELGYDPEYFEYTGREPLGKLPADLGYAGFGVQFHTDFQRDLAAFLGASYFRAVGASMQFGMSARGLAIDTALPSGEEFPVFTAFWLVRPAPGEGKLTFYALLDSPSTTGAYAFELFPGCDTVMHVDAALYPRRPIKLLGLAPLTSMFLVGENDQGVDYDWRPEIHDSDGLAIWTGGGERVWRPLVNPPAIRVNSFFDQNPRGFGLLQRDRNFDHYQDDGVFYDKRPGVWVEPVGDWGQGAVMLTEFPARDETFDNVVVFWNPEKPFEPGREHLVSYRLTWGAALAGTPSALATVRATRTGLGGVVGRKRTYFSWRFVVDFAGGMLEMLGEKTRIEPEISASRGRIEITSARPLKSINGCRVMFDLVPDASVEPVDLRLYLKLGDQALSETWIYQYSPPPKDKRSLY